MTSAGYIHDQRCPTDPDHGKALALDAGMFCPHEGHTSPKTGITQSFWTWDQWEAAKAGETKSPTTRPRIAIDTSKRSRHGKTSRRRAR